MPSATTTLSTLGTTIVDTGVGLAQTIFTTYWPYILVFGVLISLDIWVKRLIGISHR